MRTCKTCKDCKNEFAKEKFAKDSDICKKCVYKKKKEERRRKKEEQRKIDNNIESLLSDTEVEEEDPNQGTPGFNPGM